MTGYESRHLLNRLLLELLAERDRMRHGGLEPNHVELTLPAADNHGGDAIAHEIGQRPALAHELVDAEQDRKRLDRDIGDNCKGRRKRDETRAGDARGAFRRDHRDGQNPELLAQSKRRVRRLREKQRRKRHIDVGAIEIKAVAGRDDEPNDGFGGAEALHLLDHVRQHGFRGARAEHDQQFVLDVNEEAQDREAGQTGDGAEHEENEEQTCEIEGRDQLEQVHQRDYAIRADGKRHGPKGPDRRRAHDDADHAEEDFRHGIDHGVDALTQIAEVRNGEAGQNGDQQDLQEIAFGERTDERLGDDRQQVADHALFLGAANKAGDGIGIERRRVDIESPARLQNFPDDEPNGERQRRYGFEIDEGLDADPADLLEVAHRADAVHDRAE